MSEAGKSSSSIDAATKDKGHRLRSRKTKKPFQIEALKFILGNRKKTADCEAVSAEPD